MGKSEILLINKKIMSNTLTKDQIIATSKKIHRKIKETNSIITETLDLPTNNCNLKKNNLLFCIPYTLKDNISTSNIKSTGGSNFLTNYIPTFDATLYEILKDQGAVLTSKSNLDEFGLGATGLCSAMGYVKNYHDLTKITGGSSSGTVNLVASGACSFGIATDTGDSIRRPATFVGVVGFKPSYGSISRYGVFPYSPSMDHVGVISRYVTDCAIVCDALFQHDNKDYTSQQSNDNLYKNLKEQKQIRFNVIKDIHIYLDENTKNIYLKSLEDIRKSGHIIEEVEFDWNTLRTLNIVYKIITFPEGNSCYYNLTGLTFGNHFDNNLTGYENNVKNNRTTGIGYEVKRRAIIGAFIKQTKESRELYEQGRKYRSKVKEILDQLLFNADAYIIPGSTQLAPKIDDVEKKENILDIIDALLLISNFTGAPSISLPYTLVNKMPYGLNINCNVKKDQKLLNIALTLEEIFKFKQVCYYD